MDKQQPQTGSKQCRVCLRRETHEVESIPRTSGGPAEDYRRWTSEPRGTVEHEPGLSRWLSTELTNTV